jgi:phosphomannomutase
MKSKTSRNEKSHLFRAYDIRGVYPSDLDEQFYLEVGKSVALFARKRIGNSPHFYVGYDIRISSSMLAYALVTGMVSLGASVTFSGQPFPFGVNLYSGLAHKVDITAFVTASHLPPEWNGVKFYYSDGVGLSEEDNDEIRKIYIEESYNKQPTVQNWKSISEIKIKYYFNEYQNFLKKHLSLNKKLNIIVDCGNGSASLSAPNILRNNGYQVLKLWCDPNPEFPNRSPEPDENSLGELSKRIIEQKFDFGIGFDADGDRGVVVDNKGRIINPEHLGILIVKYLLKMKNDVKLDTPSIVLANVECSSVIEKTLSSDVTIKRIKVGHTYLTAEAKRSDALLGMESSGHYVFPQYFLFDDAMLIPLLTGKTIEYFNKSLSELVDELPVLHKAKITIEVSDEEKFKVIDSLKSALKKKSSYSINDIDGIGIFLDDGWVLIRASNTSPLIRVTTEASTFEKAQKILEEFYNLTLVEIKGI